MNRKLAVGRLWWKELRQLFPLVGLLFIVGLLLQLLSLTSPPEFRWRNLSVVLGMPGLFAAGAGALLVGQEKELRTLDWLRSLPVLPRDIMRTKLLTGLLGLVLVWLASLATAAIFNDGPNHVADSIGEWLWALHSLFLLLLGFATAWQLRSSFISLLLLLPLACVPLALASLHEIVSNSSLSPYQHEPRPWVMALYLLLCSVAALAWGWRAALAYFSPERSLAATSTRSVLESRTGLTTYARSTPAPALLWQFSAQNRAALVGITALLLAACYGLWVFSRAAALQGEPPPLGLAPLAPLTTLAGLLAVSWLGLLVFQGDSLQRRKQFLADRGVSPALTWLTRMAMPLLLLVVAILLASLVAQRQSLIALGFNLWLMGAAAIFVIFAVAQWVGQVIRSPIVGAVLGPPVSLLAVGYLFFSVSNLGASWWSVAPLVVLPISATFVATSAWMDGRTGWRFWVWHSVVLALCILLPCSGFLSYMAMYPRMSPASRQQLQQLANSRPAGMFPSGATLLLDSSDPSASDPSSNNGLDGRAVGLDKPESKPAHETLAEYRQLSIANLRRHMALNPSGRADFPTLKIVLTDALLQRLADPEAGDASRTERYRESLSLFHELTQRQRRSLVLLDQDIADRMELALLQELLHPLAQQRMGDELKRSLLLTLGDQAGRDRARRSALAFSWAQSQTNTLAGPQRRDASNSLGRYNLQNSGQLHVTLRDVWDASRKAGLVSERLLKLLDASTDQQRDQLRAEIRAMIGLPPVSAGSNTMYLETEQGQELLYAELWNRFSLPGQLWHGEWEQIARQMAQSIATRN